MLHQCSLYGLSVGGQGAGIETGTFSQTPLGLLIWFSFKLRTEASGSKSIGWKLPHPLPQGSFSVCAQDFFSYLIKKKKYTGSQHCRRPEMLLKCSRYIRTKTHCLPSAHIVYLLATAGVKKKKDMAENTQ